jgi:putative membrane protein
MDRRSFGTTLLTGLVGAAAAPTLAQYRSGRPDAMPMGPAEERHAMDTLAIGAVALETSRLARDRALRPAVRQFAQFEAEEQTDVAGIIRDMMGTVAPPPPNRRDARMIADLGRLRGAAFDRMYITGQVDGHRRLLDVQERYLSDGRNLHHRHIAILARGRIREHLADLERLQNRTA